VKVEFAEGEIIAGGRGEERRTEGVSEGK